MFSIVATETSVLTFISVPGLAYRGDWIFLQLSFGYIIGRVFVSFFLLPKYFSSGITSIYEIIGNKFGHNIQKISSLIFLVTRVCCCSFSLPVSSILFVLHWREKNDTIPRATGPGLRKDAT